MRSGTEDRARSDGSAGAAEIDRQVTLAAVRVATSDREIREAIAVDVSRARDVGAVTVGRTEECRRRRRAHPARSSRVEVRRAGASARVLVRDPHADDHICEAVAVAVERRAPRRIRRRVVRGDDELPHDARVCADDAAFGSSCAPEVDARCERHTRHAARTDGREGRENFRARAIGANVDRGTIVLSGENPRKLRSVRSHRCRRQRCEKPRRSYVDDAARCASDGAPRTRRRSDTAFRRPIVRSPPGRSRMSRARRLHSAFVRRCTRGTWSQRRTRPPRAWCSRPMRIRHRRCSMRCRRSRT